MAERTDSAPPAGSTPTDGVTPGGSPDGAHAVTAELAPDAPTAADQRDRRRRRRRLLAAGMLILVLAGVAVAVLLNTGSPSHKATAGGVPAGESTTTVSRRTLSESTTVDGTLAYGAALELYDRLSGTYTWLPSVGAVVTRGGALWRVNDLPVVLMYGSVPAYRTLKQGVSSGPDVRELNENLIALGYDPYGAITNTEVFGEASADAVRRFQHAEGLPETGEVELGRVVFAPSARRVTSVHVQLGQDPGGSPAGQSPSKGSLSKDSPSKDSPSKRSPSKGSPSKDSPSKESPSGEGESAGASEAVLSTTPTQELVQLKLKPDEQQLVHVGLSAPVTLPSGNVVRGRVIEVGSVASEASKGAGEGGGGESESATIAVTLELERRVAHLDEAPVSVELVKALRRGVLAVAATALIATAGGGYAIEALEEGRRAQLPVSIGMFADGYVQVEGAGVREGLTVLESE
jgi:multidrug efflux system membrane fusion protein